MRPSSAASALPPRLRTVPVRPRTTPPPTPMPRPAPSSSKRTARAVLGVEETRAVLVSGGKLATPHRGQHRNSGPRWCRRLQHH
jgi:hypothetical protein